MLLLLGLSAYAVIFVVGRSETTEESSSWIRQNEITIGIFQSFIQISHWYEVKGHCDNDR